MLNVLLQIFQEIMDNTILFVDDDYHITDGLRRTFRKERYKILCANSANEALNLLTDKKVDIVVSDEKMSGISGSEFLSIVRQKYPDTVRMILSGQASLESTIRAINKGEIYRFFTKPCNIMELLETIRQALDQKKQEKENLRLLEQTSHQKAALKAIEKKHPGITMVKRDKDGAVIIDD